MNTLNTYIARNCVLYTILIGIPILILTSFIKLNAILLEVTIHDMSAILSIVINILPYILYYIGPMIIIAVLITAYYKYILHNEIVAIESIGISKSQFASIHIYFAILCAILLSYNNLFIMPEAYNEVKNFRKMSNHIEVDLVPKTFSKYGETYIYVENIQDLYVENIIIYSASIFIKAKKGRLGYQKNGLQIFLYNGEIVSSGSISQLDQYYHFIPFDLEEFNHEYRKNFHNLWVEYKQTGSIYVMNEIINRVFMAFVVITFVLIINKVFLYSGLEIHKIRNAILLAMIVIFALNILNMLVSRFGDNVEYIYIYVFGFYALISVYCLFGSND